MKQIIVKYILNIINKYNDLVLHHLMVLPMLIGIGILISFFQDLFVLFIYTIIIGVLTVLFYLLINKARTCPTCKSWKYSVFSSRPDNSKATYYCKRCENTWQR